MKPHREHGIVDIEMRHASRSQELVEAKAALKSTEDHLEANRLEMDTQLKFPDDDQAERIERLTQERSALEEQRAREQQEVEALESRTKCAHDDLAKAKRRA